MSGTFNTQFASVASVFDDWTVCERTVVLCSLMRRVPWCNLRLLNRSIDAALFSQSSPETEKIEQDANDPVVIAQTVKTTDDDDSPVDIGEKLRKILVYLPLLEPTNDSVKEVYLDAVPGIVLMCVDGNKYTDECQQMLTYLLIHPGLNSDDRKSLSLWLKYLENHWTHNTWQQWAEASPYGSNYYGNVGFRRTIGKNIDFRGSLENITFEQLQESFTKNGKEINFLDSDNLDIIPAQPKPRSNSLTPAMPSYAHMSSSAENLSKDEHFVQKPRSFSLSSEHMAQIKPIKATTGSESRLDDLKLSNIGEHPGMSNIGIWLKSLRLHKYAWLFTNISYEQMMSINDEYLQKMGVTKGARHKLLLCINKLHERRGMLEAMYRDLATGSLSVPLIARLLDNVRGILLSPISPTSSLPALIVSVLEMASTRLLNTKPYPSLPAYPAYNQNAEENISYDAPTISYDPVSLHCWLIDRTLHHPSFNWSKELVNTLKRLRYRLPPRQFFSHLSELPFAKRSTKQRWRTTGPSSTPAKPQAVTQKRLSIQSNWIPPHESIQQPQESQYKSSSFPVFPPTALSQNEHPKICSAPNSLGDINSRLESLCLQMTEQAIN